MPSGHDKNWVLCAATDGFRAHHGLWPTRVGIFPASFSDIREHPFTPDNYARITAKVALNTDVSPMVAEDDSGGSYNYGQEGFPPQRPTAGAAEWLSVRPPPEEH